MLATQNPQYRDIDAFISYSRSLHDYTLQLWMESRRQVEERAQARANKISPEALGSGARWTTSQPIQSRR